jgi:hypothetical protein
MWTTNGRRCTRDDGDILVLAPPASAPHDPGNPIGCGRRPSDVWWPSLA